MLHDAALAWAIPLGLGPVECGGRLRGRGKMEELGRRRRRVLPRLVHVDRRRGAKLDRGGRGGAALSGHHRGFPDLEDVETVVLEGEKGISWMISWPQKLLFCKRSSLSLC